MPEPMTPVPNLVHRRSTSERRTDRLRRLDSAQARGKPMVVIGSPGDTPRVLEHPVVLNGRFTVSATLAVGDSPGEIERLASPTRLRWQPVAKRVIDIVVAAIGIVLCAPLLALLAAAIRAESSGSPVFRHERIGYRGKRFLCLKLRTMRTDAEAQLRSDPHLYEEYRRHHFKIPDDRDPRVTKFGRFLRQTSLDELPQLWNVLMGQMSLVGPRPVVEEELGLYGEKQDLVLSVRPGITGAWAVNGRQLLGYPERCAIELSYVRQWTVTGDLRILAQTAAIVTRSALAGTCENAEQRMTQQ